MPQDGEISGWPSAPSFSYIVIYYFIIYLFVLICCLLAAALSGLLAPGVGGGVFVLHPCSIAAAPGALSGSGFRPLLVRVGCCSHCAGDGEG